MLDVNTLLCLFRLSASLLLKHGYVYCSPYKHCVMESPKGSLPKKIELIEIRRMTAEYTLLIK